MLPSGFLAILVSKKRIELASSNSFVNFMLPVMSAWLRCIFSWCTESSLTIARTSSTYLFHSLGLIVGGAVDKTVPDLP